MHFEDVVLLGHGKAVGVLINPARYEELLQALEDLNDIEAVALFREHPEPTMEAGEFFARLDADQAR
jgi:PHD/YefM family antitoxin component YafN of YafNO toxin-antitoxin module